MAKRKGPKWYAVQRGRIPGVYDTWDECKVQVEGFRGACFKSFFTPEEAHGFARSRNGYGYFAPTVDFVPDKKAGFEDEFKRFASSQNWMPDSKQFKTERTNAIVSELTRHYVPGSSGGSSGDREPSNAKKLEVYHVLCEQVGIKDPPDTIDGCVRILRTKYVNIVDFIDACRIGDPIVVWEDFQAFSEYTLREENRINLGVAKKNWLLSSLLQRLSTAPQRHPGQGMPVRDHACIRRVRDGRVEKKNPTIRQASYTGQRETLSPALETSIVAVARSGVKQESGTAPAIKEEVKEKPKIVAKVEEELEIREEIEIKDEIQVVPHTAARTPGPCGYCQLGLCGLHGSTASEQLCA